MVEMLVNGFEIDGSMDHEMSIFRRPERRFDIFVSKRPGDMESAASLLRIDPNLWFVHMVRDPRDVIVSRHAKAPDEYWTNLGIWNRRRRAARKAEGHPRFITVRYEDLVTDPDGVQDRLMGRMPFLRKRANFSDFHRTARPSEDSLRALGGLRAAETSRIGAWRDHKPRVAAQIAIHGPIDRDLIELGYEVDGDWIRALDGVVPDNGPSHLPERTPRLQLLRQELRLRLDVIRYALGLVRRQKTT
jgi:hypothetical protein